MTDISTIPKSLSIPTITVSGANTFKGGLGTNTFTAGTGANTLDFSDTNVALTINALTGSASGTGITDTFSGVGKISFIIGNNAGDTITAGSGAETITAGSGNDSITASNSVLDNIYGGNGTNTFSGGFSGDHFYGGTGNNTFNSPVAGTIYDGTHGANLTVIASNLAYSFTNGGSSGNSSITVGDATVITNGTAISIDLNMQLNWINYSADSSGLTINLASGTGTGGTAQGSSYAFTPTSGYSSINEISVGNATVNYLTPSNSDTVLIGGIHGDYFYDQNTIASQTNILVGGGNTGGQDDYYDMGAAKEVIVGGSGGGYDRVYYNYSPTGVVVNLDNVSHTFTNASGGTSMVAAFSGSSKGDTSAYSIGDYYVPVTGSGSTLNASIELVQLSSAGNDVFFGGANYVICQSAYYNTSASNTEYIYAGSGNMEYDSGSGTDYFYGGSGAGGDLYRASYGNDRAVGSSGSTSNVFYAVDNQGRSFNVTIYLNGNLNTQDQPITSPVNLTSGGVTYAGYMTGYNTAVTATATLFSNFENVVGYGGNDLLVGDDSNNSINGRTGNNTIYGLAGNDTITAIEGNNTIDGGTGTNTINFEWASNSIANGGNTGNNSNVSQFGVNPASGDIVMLGDGSFFGASDKTTIMTSTYSGFQAITGYGTNSITNCQIINGSDYTSGNTSTAVYDEVLYGTSTTTKIWGNGGNNIIAGGSATDTLYGGSGNNIFYETVAQLTNLVGINGTEWAGNQSTGIAIANGKLDILRVEGWGAGVTAGNAFGGTDPFSGTKYTNLNVVDVRSGTDSLSSNTLTTTSGNITLNEGANALTNNSSHPTFNLSATDIQHIMGATSATNASYALRLYLDGGDNFVATAGSFVTSGSKAINGISFTEYTYHNGSLGGAIIAIVDVHTGTGTA
jgi:Ca2+-binding RTX toxin-like protein